MSHFHSGNAVRRFTGVTTNFNRFHFVRLTGQSVQMKRGFRLTFGILSGGSFINWIMKMRALSVYLLVVLFVNGGHFIRAANAMSLPVRSTTMSSIKPQQKRPIHPHPVKRPTSRVISPLRPLVPSPQPPSRTRLIAHATYQRHPDDRPSSNPKDMVPFSFNQIGMAPVYKNLTGLATLNQGSYS